MDKQQATFGSGCFWCSEAIFAALQGVLKVTPGYAGGNTEEPTYKQVCTGDTGHAEVIQIVFKPDVITYEQLLQVFFTTHDPTTLNRQGSDVGTQYRSVIFYHNNEQKEIAIRVREEMGELWDDPIVTEITEIPKFYPAEPYHKNYFAINPEQAYCQMVIAPKVAKFRHQYKELIR